MNGAGVFFNTKITNNRCCLESTGNALLSPVRALFGGRTVVHVDGCFIMPPKAKQSLFVKMLKVTCALIFVIPGLVLGTFVKGIAMLRRCVRQTHRNFIRLFNDKTMNKDFVTDKNGTYQLLGNRSTFKPSLESYQNNYPWKYLGDLIKDPTALHLQGMKMEHVERLLRLSTVDWKGVVTVDLTGVNPTQEMLKLLIEKCPNIESLRCTNLSRVDQETVNTLLTTCTQLNQISKDELQALPIYVK